MSEKTLTIADLFRVLDSYELNYAYNGDFTNYLTERILALIETNMEVNGEPLRIKKKVYFIILESLQNITRHQLENEQNKAYDAFFSLHKFSDVFLIGSGNIIENTNIPELTQKLEKVNALTAEELRQYQKDILSKGDFSEKGGAGLGLIEIVRKSGNKLSYQFKEISNESSYFYCQSMISSPVVNGANVYEGDKYDVVKNVHKVVVDNNLKIFFQGQFKHENVTGLLSMVEGSAYINENQAFKKTSVSIMIELLQNISYHAVGLNNSEDRPGLFMVSDSNNVCSLITGNYVESSKVEELKNKIKLVNALNIDEMEQLYLETIVLEQSEQTPGAGLGFIDIRIKSRNKIEVETVPSINDKTFLIIKTFINY